MGRTKGGCKEQERNKERALHSWAGAGRPRPTSVAAFSTRNHSHQKTLAESLSFLEPKLKVDTMNMAIILEPLRFCPHLLYWS